MLRILLRDNLQQHAQQVGALKGRDGGRVWTRSGGFLGGGEERRGEHEVERLSLAHRPRPRAQVACPGVAQVPCPGGWRMGREGAGLALTHQQGARTARSFRTHTPTLDRAGLHLLVCSHIATTCVVWNMGAQSVLYLQ